MYSIFSKTFVLIFVAVIVTACGGGGRTGSGNSASGAAGGGTGTGTATVSISLQAGLTQLSAGGSTGITALLTDDQGNPYATATPVSFSSLCIGTALATVTSPVTSNSGAAVTTYTAQGCSGADTVTASATVNETVISASVTITVLSATLGSIEFVSAAPTNIALKGMGGAGQSETSIVTFRVRDTAGGTINNQSVTFTLNTSVGGLAFSPGTNTATSGTDGLIQAIVQSGTVATPVRVTATVDSTGIATQSDQLVVTTGIPDNNSFTLSAVTLNSETWGHDGVQVGITAYLADRFNNPVPNGTTVLFTTEGGSIGGSCQTAAGACSVNWTSQNPRPDVDALNGTTDNRGRVTVRATAVGEESFIDANGNGTFDAGETFTDLVEAFLDENEDGIRQSSEPFADFNSNLNYDPADGVYNGVVCTASSCAVSTLNVRNSLVLVMSGSFANIVFSPPGPLDVKNAPVDLLIYIVDNQGHNQIMPAGTTIDFSTDNGILSGPTSYTVVNTADNCAPTKNPGRCTYPINVDTDTTTSNGTLTVTVTSPLGLTTFGLIKIND